eukprot:SAG22_NODE_10732_length_518_cov_6.711217_1_plen_52_part_01
MDVNESRLFTGRYPRAAYGKCVAVALLLPESGRTGVLPFEEHFVASASAKTI